MAHKIYATDTFGGELNYSWIQSIDLPFEDITPRKALKLFREEYGYTCKLRKVFDSHDFIRWNIPGTCIAIVLDYSY